MAKSYKTTLAVIIQSLSLHYAFISYNMKPHSLESCIWNEKTRTHVVVAKFEF